MDSQIGKQFGEHVCANNDNQLHSIGKLIEKLATKLIVDNQFLLHLHQKLKIIRIDMNDCSIFINIQVIVNISDYIFNEID